MAYLDLAGIESCISYLAKSYPMLVSVQPLPEPSREGRTMRAMRLGANSRGNRRGVLMLGGVHARELVNPDMLLSLAVQLCSAYSAGAGLSFGGKTFSSTDVVTVLETLDIWMIPCVNPDGRVYVQSPAGDAMWRKNRAVNSGTTCRGVDLNRNCDFLWPYTIGQTSSDPCNETYHGPSPFSEPEERNVRWMLDAFPAIRVLVDVHSYSELVLYPWGDDTTQTADTGETFLNQGWDGQRGAVGGYAEYMPVADLNRFQQAAGKIVDAIKTVRGRAYTAEPSFSLYGTTGCNDDYAYSRHFADPSKGKVYAFTFETGREFQPAAVEAAWVIKEGSAGLMQLLLESVCAIDFIGSGLFGAQQLHQLGHFRDHVLAASSAGSRVIQLLERHSLEIAHLASQHPALADRLSDTLAQLAPSVLNGEAITAEHLDIGEAAAHALVEHASPALVGGIEEMRALARELVGQHIEVALAQS